MLRSYYVYTSQLCNSSWTKLSMVLGDSSTATPKARVFGWDERVMDGK